MPDKTTFIKIDRKITKWRWYTEPNTLRVFLHLLIIANYEQHQLGKLTIHRGEAMTSVNELSRELGLAYNTVKKALNNLVTTGEITIKHFPRCTLVKIINYNSYQASPRPAASGQKPWEKKGMAKEEYDRWANQ